MRTIAIVNQKGGCGKTTTAINLAALCAQRGLRTLLVDMDPQSHCAAGLGVPESRIEYSIGDALLADLSAAFDPGPLVWEVARNLHLAPSTVMLSALEAPGGGLHQLPDKDRRLENLLAAIKDKYDRCLIDCPPTIGLLTYNALRAAKEALIPVETGFFSLRGAEKQWMTIQRMIAHIGRPIACHLLPTLHNPQSQLACNILAALRRQFAGQIIPVVIHEDEALREAASFGQPVQEYAPQSRARHDFDALADWLEDHASRPTVQIEILPDQASAALGGPGASGDAARTDAPPGGGRAAELARRVHNLTARAAGRGGPADAAVSPPLTQIIESSAPAIPARAHTPNSAATVEPAKSQSAIASGIALILTEAPPLAEPMTFDGTPDVSHLYGVRQTSRGVLFVQPGHAGQAMAVAGDFNHWSSRSHPMRYNESMRVFEALIPLPPGTFQYRLVIDGEWVADGHNGHQQLNSYGEPNSVITVTEAEYCKSV